MAACRAANATKLEDEFNKLRAQMEQVLARFRQSGMGECVDEEKKMQQCYTVYASNFVNFCDTQPVLLYAYEVLVKSDGLLKSFSCAMPPTASHSSDIDRSVLEDEDENEGDDRQGASRNNKKGRNSERVAYNERFLAALRQPMFERSSETSRLREDRLRLENEKLRYETDTQKIKSRAAKLQHLAALRKLIAESVEAGEANSPLVIALQAEKAALECDIIGSVVSQASSCYVPPADSLPNSDSD